jgi:hypothetical protein
MKRERRLCQVGKPSAYPQHPSPPRLLRPTMGMSLCLVHLHRLDCHRRCNFRLASCGQLPGSCGPSLGPGTSCFALSSCTGGRTKGAVRPTSPLARPAPRSRVVVEVVIAKADRAISGRLGPPAATETRGKASTEVPSDIALLKMPLFEGLPVHSTRYTANPTHSLSLIAPCQAAKTRSVVTKMPAGRSRFPIATQRRMKSLTIGFQEHTSSNGTTHSGGATTAGRSVRRRTKRSSIL